MKTAVGPKRRSGPGYAVFAGLIAFKVAEYFIGTRVHSGGWGYLALIAIGGSLLILYFFMRIDQLGRPKGSGHE